MQIDQAPPAPDVKDWAPRDKRDLIYPLVLAAGGGVTVVWIGFLVWGALQLASYVFS